MISLWTNSAGSAPGSNPSTNFPNQKVAFTAPISDLTLYNEDPSFAANYNGALFTFANPFGNYQLASNTTYWIELTTATPGTSLGWDLLNGAVGTNVSGKDWVQLNLCEWKDLRH